MSEDVLAGGVPAPMHEKRSFLDVRDLRVHFPTDDGVVKSVDGLSFQLERGKRLGIVGESGSGKSVTSLSIMGLHKAGAAKISGEIWVGDTELVSADPETVRKLRGKTMAMIFQDPLSAMHPYYTVGAQIVEAYRLHHDVGKKAARKRAVELLDRVGIPQPESRFDDYPHQFSGGMRQRAMIAMALSCNPDLLIADEPTTALDVTVQAQILDLILDLQKEFDSAVIIITHDLGRGRRAGRRHPRHVRRAGGGVRRGARRLRAAPAPVHVGAARLDAADRPGALRAAPADPRQPAEPDQRAVGLRVPPAVRLRGAHGGAGAHRAAGAARGGAGPPGGLPSSGRGAPEDLRRGDRAVPLGVVGVQLAQRRRILHQPAELHPPRKSALASASATASSAAKPSPPPACQPAAPLIVLRLGGAQLELVHQLRLDQDVGHSVLPAIGRQSNDVGRESRAARPAAIGPRRPKRRRPGSRTGRPGHGFSSTGAACQS